MEKDLLTPTETDLLTPMETDWLTVKELMQYLKVPDNTIYSWVHRDAIPHHYAGRLLRFSKKEIDAWVLAGKKPVLKVSAGIN